MKPAVRHALDGLRSATSCGEDEAPAASGRTREGPAFVHDHLSARDGWRHRVVVVPTGTALLRMTSPDGLRTTLAVNGVDPLGRSTVSAMLGTRPFACLSALAGLTVSERDTRERLHDLMSAGMADLISIDPDDDAPELAVSWDGEPSVAASRSDACAPWPRATTAMLSALRDLGPLHRLTPSLLPPALASFLGGDARPCPEWDVDGLVLGSESSLTPDLGDPVSRLRAMAECDAARRRIGSPPGTMMARGVR